jgi:hypothetical protein
MDLTNLNLNKDRSKIRRKPPVDLSTMVYGKVPPQAKELEEAVLGAIMLEKSWKRLYWVLSCWKRVLSIQSLRS